MFQVGFSEILLVIVVAFIVLGPRRLPEAVAHLARAMTYLHKVSKQVMNEINNISIIVENSTKSTIKPDKQLPEKKADE